MNFQVNEIFNIKNNEHFNELSIKIFQYQYKNNLVYQQFVDYLFQHSKKNIESIKHYTQIPFLPIEFFKSHTITCFEVHNQTPYFESSGTTKQNLSRHYIYDEKIYQTSILKGFEMFYGHPKDYLFIFLLPEESERPYSSLIYMAKYLMSFSSFNESGFYLKKMNVLPELLNKYHNSNVKVFILGLSYALMDFAEMNIRLNDNVIVMETGGMKGKREELPKNIFYAYLKNKLGISKIHSEYGMTELFSQAYSKENGIFYTPLWMKVLVRETNDPLTLYEKNKQGIINVIDLANFYTCSFIATADLGKINSDGSFEILGRSDFSDIRGCNLMYQ